MNKIENIEQLKAEIHRLQLRKKEKEEGLRLRVDDFSDKLKPVMSVLDIFGIADFKQTNPVQTLSKFVMNKGVQFGLPYLLNRLIFSSKSKAGLISAFEIAATEGVKALMKSDPKKIFSFVSGLAKDLFSKNGKAKPAPKKTGFATRNDNLEQDIYS